MHVAILSISEIVELVIYYSSIRFLDLHVQETCHTLAFEMMVVHAGLVDYSAVSLAPILGRDFTICFIIVLLAVPFNVATLQTFGPVATRNYI